MKRLLRIITILILLIFGTKSIFAEDTINSNSGKIEIIKGLFINEENLDLYDNFKNFRFIDIDKDYIYYNNIYNNTKIYKIKINNNYIFADEEEYRKNPQIIFSEKINLEPYYFVSGEFDDINNYDFDIPESKINFSKKEAIFSLSANNITTKSITNNGEKISEEKGYIYDYNDGYFYFRNLNDNRTIYRINKDGSGLRKVVDIPYLYINLIDDNYIYYRNYDDDTKMYRIKKDGSEINSGGNVFVDINNTIALFENNGYIYYINRDDENKLYRKNSNGLYDGIKVIDSYGSSIFKDGDYIYYRKNDDSYSLYKVGINSDSEIGKKIFIFNTSLYYNFDENYNDDSNLFFYGGDNTNSGIYKIDKNGADINKSLIKIKDGNTGIDNLLENGNYIYYRNFEDNYKIYRVKKNGTQLSSGGISISSLENSYSLFIENNELYYKNNYLYKVDLNNIDNNSYGIQLSSMSISEVINIENDDYVYFSNSNYLYRVSKNEQIVEVPSKLKQEILSPYMDSRDEVEIGEKIGKFQSGSGIILSAEINNNTGENIRLAFDIYRFGEKYPIEVYYSNNGDYIDITSGRLETIIDYLGAGEYYWKARVETESGNNSEDIDFGTNNSWKHDYGLYEGFEPYPYGYKFYNSGVADGLLTGSGYKNIKGYFDLSGFYKVNNIVDGNKWDIFEKAFDISSFEDNEGKMIAAFESVGLNRSDVFQGGNCYGMAVSAAMQYSHPDFMQSNYSSFSTKVGNGYIWDNISKLSVDGNDNWNDYDDNKILETILSFQLSQNSTHIQEAISNNYKTPTKIITELKNNPNNTYALFFLGKNKNNKDVGHAVIPYKVEETPTGSLIYIWDNNIPFPYTSYDKNKKSYEQFMKINTDNTWSVELYNWSKFSKISLVNLDEIYNNGNKSTPLGFNGDDISLTLSGSSNLYISDSLGRVSGFLSGSVLEEIPGVEVIIPLNATLSGAIENNNWKQIYLPKRQDLTVKVSADTDESYDLMIAGGDYYTKISGVETNSGQVDSFIPTRENLQIDFDDNKQGEYDLIIDNFHNNGTGSIYIGNIESKPEAQQYIVSWTGVIENSNEAIIYEVDTDNDGIYDEQEKIPPVVIDKSETNSAKISGHIYFDKNKNGKKDKREFGLLGYKVFIDLNNDGKLQEEEPYTFTNIKGYYKFDSLKTGVYNIKLTGKKYKLLKKLSKKLKLIPENGEYTIELSNGEVKDNVNFEVAINK